MGRQIKLKEVLCPLRFGEKKGTIETDRHQSIQAEVGIFYAEKHTSLKKILPSQSSHK